MHCGYERSQSAARGVLLTGVLQTSTFHQPESPDGVCQARQTVVRRLNMKRKWHHSPHPSGNRWGRRLRSERWGSAGGRWSTEEKQRVLKESGWENDSCRTRRWNMRCSMWNSERIQLRTMSRLSDSACGHKYCSTVTDLNTSIEQQRLFNILLVSQCWIRCDVFCISVTVIQRLLHHSPGRADSGSHKWPPSSQGSPWPWRRPRRQSGCSRRSLQPWSYLWKEVTCPRSSSLQRFYCQQSSRTPQALMERWPTHSAYQAQSEAGFNCQS